jgi:hypothetical protein
LTVNHRLLTAPWCRCHILSLCVAGHTVPVRWSALSSGTALACAVKSPFGDGGRPDISRQRAGGRAEWSVW